MTYSPQPIINIEINEMPLEVTLDYIQKFPESQLSKLLKQKRLKTFETIALDIDKEKLYPSQTWASMLTGKKFEEHKCYWYSDPIEEEDLIWNSLASKNISVGILGSLHSSKLPKDLVQNQNYNFYIPDCFSSSSFAKPNIYERFQSINNLLVGKSARVIDIKEILNTAFNLFIRSIFQPKRYGLTLYSFKQIIYLFLRVIITRNLENLRMAQFPLISSIYLDLIKKNLPKYSSIFSNHLAGNMHRYWYAYKRDQFDNKNIYSVNWIKKNFNAIYDPLHLLDNFLENILKIRFKKKPIILITASMGQEARPDFSKDPTVNVKMDGKLTKIDLFLKALYQFSLKKYNFKFELKYERNMAPQYGFYVPGKFDYKLNLIVNIIKEFLKEFKFNQFEIDTNSNSIVITLSPWHEIDIQKRLISQDFKKSLEGIGFSFYKIEDHHSGSHSRRGLFAIIDSDKKFLDSVESYLEENKCINYINFKSIINNYLLA